MAECEALLLGREAIHGCANATALAVLVKTLMRKSEFHRKYILCCSCDHGLQMIPYRRLEDEGFESDEDLTSLGSYDSSSSIYVSDHALRTSKCGAPPVTDTPAVVHTSSQMSAGKPTSVGSVSSVGTDSANSSGASDNDDTDNSLNHHLVNRNQRQCFDDKKKTAAADDVENFAFHEIAFCHTDSSLPRVIVWVVKTKRQSKITNEYTYGLEAIVFLCHSEQKFRELYKCFQEFSRRQKLEKPVRNRCKEECRPTTVARKFVSPPSPSRPVAGEKSSTVKSEGCNNAVMFNLVHRVDMNGVTHIEVTRPESQGRPPKMLSDSEPSSIISINTPDSGDVKTLPKKCEKLIEGVIKTEDKNAPPERPERKKGGRSSSKDKAPLTNREKVVRGQFVRVSVDQKTLSSPVARGGWLFSEAKPCGNVLSYPSRLVWSRNEKENDQQHASHRSRKEMERSQRFRSKSSVPLRRQESPKRYPMSHRYVDAIHLNNSLPNRFFGRLKELTGVTLQPKCRRRNSIGDLTNANYYQVGEKRFDKNHALAKSTPNLKSMIKNKNGRFFKDGYNENEPKKVTFSAYATVQVVD